jgi:hypothetical protein
MEKAAALALAASILNQLHETYVHYLVDNQLLVNFTNGVDLFDPPDWRITPFTQLVRTPLAGISSSVHRIYDNKTRWHTYLQDKVFPCSKQIK